MQQTTHSYRQLAPILLLYTYSAVFLVILPGIVGAMIDLLHFSVEQTGWVASSNMFGSALMAFYAYRFVSHATFKQKAVFALVLMFVGALAIAASPPYALLLLSAFVMGVGSGLLMTATLNQFAMHEQRERIFAACLALQLIVGAIVFSTLSAVLSWAGWGGLFSLIAGFGALFAGITAFARNPGLVLADTSENRPTESRVRLDRYIWLCLIAYIFFNVGTNVVWTYFERIGVQFLTMEATSNIIAWSMLLGSGFCVLPLLIGKRLGNFRPILISMIAVVASFIYLANDATELSYLAALIFFNGSLPVAVPYFQSLMVDFDRAGHILTLGVGIFWTTLVIGPLLGAYVEKLLGFDSIVMISSALFLLSILLVYPAAKNAVQRTGSQADNVTNWISMETLDDRSE